ncbi:hypothetical protein Syun_007511 [Stephania yunnanensis]|uniref:Uncharacterized protein n=1 Tax=Stephania yunnanensis TaxID=152371 RepID=A0AAP0PZE7_9MAGN
MNLEGMSNPECTLCTVAHAREKAKKQKTNEHDDDIIDVDELIVETPLTFPPFLSRF